MLPQVKAFHAPTSANATTEPRVLRNYLIGLAIADVGHVYATYLAMGWDAFP
jgi:hypothetical protein